MKADDPSKPAAPAPSSELLLSCEELAVGFGETPLLPPFNLQIRRGSFISVVGRNGSGKSTWFKTLLGMLPPVSGRVVKNKPLLKCSYMPQTVGIDSVLPMRPREMVLWGRLTGWNFLNPFASRQDRKLAEAALDTAGAREFANRPYRDLSEGQKQRSLLARVIASEADLVLLDEPTAAMDAVAEKETMKRLVWMARERNMAVVVVSHDLTLAAEHANTMVFLDRETPAVIAGDAKTVFCHPAFRHQYGDEYCTRATTGGHLGHVHG
ncbi:metal ABC transporter ATP-binding protein [Hyalangium gracile]|uniref:metal ABC transporter ATP-binding protein n=1 Tax=Hyalangium gracile TaxID=394092 RepID=UPI001CCFBE08|nr:metal ABC transporter ATP-binding protein [Hyalangium gracile]